MSKMENNTNPAVLALLTRVRRSIKSQGITLVDLADRTGIKPNNISRMLSGKHSLRLDLLLKLLDAANLQISLKKIPNNN